MTDGADDAIGQATAEADQPGRGPTEEVDDGDDSMGTWIAIGIALGVALGAALDDVAMGIAIGVALGAAMGAVQSNR